MRCPIFLRFLKSLDIYRNPWYNYPKHSIILLEAIAMSKIYKSQTICEHCKEPILWYAIINKQIGKPFISNEDDYFPHRPVKVFPHDDKTATLKIYCKECGRINTFIHTLSDD
jgi:formylmethanofuran dehydrogenase subunit E